MYQARLVASAFVLGVCVTFLVVSDAVQPLWIVRYYAAQDASDLPVVATIVALCVSFVVSLEVVCIAAEPASLLNWLHVRSLAALWFLSCAVQTDVAWWAHTGHRWRCQRGAFRIAGIRCHERRCVAARGEFGLHHVHSPASITAADSGSMSNFILMAKADAASGAFVAPLTLYCMVWSALTTLSFLQVGAEQSQAANARYRIRDTPTRWVFSQFLAESERSTPSARRAESPQRAAAADS